MRKLLIGLVVATLVASAAFAYLRTVGSAQATTTPDPAAVTLGAAGVDTATIVSGTTSDGTPIFHGKRADGAVCAGFGQAVLCPRAGTRDLFADSPVVTVAVSKLIGWNQAGSPQLSQTQRTIGFARTDIASVVVTQQDGTKRQIGITDGAFVVNAGVASIQAIDSAGRTIATTVLPG